MNFEMAECTIFTVKFLIKTKWSGKLEHTVNPTVRVLFFHDRLLQKGLNSKIAPSLVCPWLHLSRNYIKTLPPCTAILNRLMFYILCPETKANNAHASLS